MGMSERMPQPAGPLDLVVRGERVLVGGAFVPAEVHVRDGVIVRIIVSAPRTPGKVSAQQTPEKKDAARADDDVLLFRSPANENASGAAEPAAVDAARIIELAPDEVLIPGLVDTHVHVNEPGRTDWEGFASATRAAAAGGVTTIVDMPLNSIPPTTSVQALEVKRAAAAGDVFVDVGFWGGVIPGNLEDLKPLVAEGVFGFKCFLVNSGVDEFPPVTADEMESAMAVIAASDSLIIVHAEDSALIDAAPHPHSRSYGDFLASRPRAAEDAAIADVIERARRTGAAAHILHLSAADALERIADAKRDGVDVTVETCPHYLTLTAEEVLPGSTAFKCCPPIREAANREALWRGLEEGVVDLVVSDHSPATPDLKYAGDGDFVEAWGGIASLQLGLPLVWTEARRRGIPLARVVEWMSAAPARRVGLAAKGAIEVGRAADLVVFAPDETFTVDAAALEHRHPVCVYDGRELTGVVRTTVLAGEPVDRESPRGRLLRRDERMPRAGVTRKEARDAAR
jgi:allantoinase